MLSLAYKMPILQPKFNELSVEQLKYERKQKILVYFFQVSFLELPDSDDWKLEALLSRHLGTVTWCNFAAKITFLVQDYQMVMFASLNF